MSGPSKPPIGHFTILFFAAATSYTKSQHDFLPAPMRVTDLWRALDQKYPGMEQKVLDSAALTVNLQYVDLEEEAGKSEGALLIQEGDEVAVIPPVSSG
jgi:molybdopterin synthase sulfur carrier subunit